ncbi:MAG: hypothetical protein ACKVQA_12820, partial [Burkholderiales bacterium]
SSISAPISRRGNPMTQTIRPLAEINRQATDVLVREMGIADALRFLNQFGSGSGDYTKERGQWIDDMSLKQITGEIKAKRTSRT